MAIVTVTQSNNNVNVIRIGQQGPAGDLASLGANLTSIDSLTMAANQLIYSTGPGAFTQTGITSFGRSLINNSSASAARTTLGLAIGTNVQAYDADLTTWAGKPAPSGTVVGTTDSQTLTNKSLPTDTVFFVDPTDATKKLAFSISGFTSGTTRTITIPNSSDTLVNTGTAQILFSKQFSDASCRFRDDVDGTKLGAFQLSGLTTGTTRILTWPDADGTIATTAVVAAGYQPLDAELTAIADLTSAADRLPYFTGSGTASLATFTSFGRSLVDDANASTARTTLGLGTIATAAMSDYVNVASTQTVTGEKTFSEATYFTRNGLSVYIRPTTGSAQATLGRIDGTVTNCNFTFNTGATATTYDSRIRATGGTGTDGGGIVDILSAKLTSTGAYSTTTASAANVNVKSDGTLARSTSSEKYKIDIEPLLDEWADKALELEPIFYRSTCDLDNKDWTWYGLSAEAVAAVDKRLVHWRTTETHDELNEDGELEPVTTLLETPEPEGVAYDRLVCHLISIVKRQDKAIKELSARIDSIVG